MTSRSPIEQVLDLARWAPSGDNTQPWRFEITGELSCVVHAFDTRRHCVYDLTGAPSQLSVGALLETARIAASTLAMRVEVSRRPGDEETPRFDLRLVADHSGGADALAGSIERRCTNRRPYSRRPLEPAEKEALNASVGPGYSLLWLEGPRRAEVARLLFASAKIRLTIPEAYAVHREIIEWDAELSETKIPDRAVGLDPIGMMLMRWAMKSWRRTHILSAYLGGTLLPRLQLELLPGLGCAAHLLILADSAPQGIDDHIRAGAAVQRLWLTATHLGLQHQPEMTPLIFSNYATREIRFTTDPGALEQARTVARRLDALVGSAETRLRAVWMGRVGEGRVPSARSTRRSLSGLEFDRSLPLA